MLIPLGIWAASGAGGGGASDFQLISTQVLTTGLASVTFSSIPSTFRHLQIRHTGRINTAVGTGSFEFDMRLNGDTATNYSWHNLSGNGSSVTSTGSASQAQIAFSASWPSYSQPAGVWGGGIIDILDYAQTTKNKTVRGLTGWSKSVQLTSGTWRSLNAVNSITIFDINAYNIQGDSRFSLYGWN